MKNIAIGILLVIFSSILIEPMVEIVNVCREKININTAVTNSCRAAKDRSLKYLSMRDLDAEVDTDLFKEYFIDAFEDSLNLTCSNRSSNTLKFTSDDGKFNDFTITLQFVNKIDTETEQEITLVSVKAETIYKFKTKYLKMLEGNANSKYKIVRDKNYILSVKN